jgi:hypothetical protein
MILGHLRSFAKQVLLILFIQNLNEQAKLRGGMYRWKVLFCVFGFTDH